MRLLIIICLLTYNLYSDTIIEPLDDGRVLNIQGVDVREKKFIFSVKGFVQDCNNNKCPNATIGFVSSKHGGDDPNKIIAKSDANGYYFVSYEETGFEDIFPLYFWIRSSDGSMCAIEKFSGSELSKDIVLQPNNLSLTCEVAGQFDRLAGLFVRVDLIFDQDALKNTLNGELFLRKEKLDHTGRITFSGLPSANCLLLTILHEDTVLCQRTVCNTRSAKGELKERFELPEFREPITGKVVDKDNKPVAGQYVRINLSKNGDWVCGVFSNEKGEFNTGWLPLDTLNFTVMQDVNGVSCIAIETLLPGEEAITLKLKSFEEYFGERGN
ncbi:MAG: hypothetical protein JW745_01330 [Sedimentisphaerales bacterium]|nr:hypothetical protein [Sedimentisphaerales bacterium]MBN2843012.1 hypothetical protein [Sedimentisphaerales bacterium]